MIFCKEIFLDIWLDYSLCPFDEELQTMFSFIYISNAYSNGLLQSNPMSISQIQNKNLFYDSNKKMSFSLFWNKQLSFHPPQYTVMTLYYENAYRWIQWKSYVDKHTIFSDQFSILPPKSNWPEGCNRLSKQTVTAVTPTG